MSILLAALWAAALLQTASGLGFLGGPSQSRWQPPHETPEPQEQAPSLDGVSPAPTSPPELAPMELFRRQDPYILPSDYCGWYDEYKTGVSKTCIGIGQSCINIGTIRGCCNGPTLSCASTFWTTCIPRSLQTNAGACGSRTLCCARYSSHHECGTAYMSSRAAPSITYTEYDCYVTKGITYGLQDYPPEILTTSVVQGPTPSPPAPSTPPSISSTPASTELPTPSTSNPTPVGAIVGGVVAFFALVVILVLGILYFRRRKSHAPPEAPVAESIPQPSYKDPLYSPSVGSPTSPHHPSGQFTNYEAQQQQPTAYTPPHNQHQHQFQSTELDQRQGLQGTPSPHLSTDDPIGSASLAQLTRGLSEQTLTPGATIVDVEDNANYGVGTGIGRREVREAETVYPFGTRDNRAELAAREGRM